MLHPKLQAQINEYLNQKTDTDNIAQLFKKISESYYNYDKQVNELHEQQVISEITSHIV